MNDEILNQIRLTAFELNMIQNAFKQYFLPNDHLWLFGSRAVANKKGGDIDLYIESHIQEPSEARKSESLLIESLWSSIGEQKIDLVVNLLSDPKELLIYKIAKNSGVQLV